MLSCACTARATAERHGTALADGLPQENAWITVLRDGFTADALDPAGLYVGTRTGEVFGSADARRVVA